MYIMLDCSQFQKAYVWKPLCLEPFILFRGLNLHNDGDHGVQKPAVSSTNHKSSLKRSKNKSKNK